MRRIPVLAVPLLLSACSGFHTFFTDSHWFGNPNKVLGYSETLLRVRGTGVEQPPLRPEPGDVWPGPTPPQPTLQELMREENEELKHPLPAPMPVPGNPPMLPSGRVPPQSNPTLPGLGAPGLPQPGPSRGSTKPPPGGHVYQTPEGPAVGTPGPGGYETLTSPRGEPGGIVVPNGNGTSTIILPDGRVLTVPTPK
jgi:hypothetical protein